MATKTVDRTEVYSQSLKNKSVGLPHSEVLTDDFATNVTRFDEDGFALVTEAQADELVLAYNGQVEKTGKTEKVKFDVPEPPKEDEDTAQDKRSKADRSVSAANRARKEQAKE